MAEIENRGSKTSASQSQASHSEPSSAPFQPVAACSFQIRVATPVGYDDCESDATLLTACTNYPLR
ncbi:MAG: hypothetical protein GY768_30150 [Planctomycetaceae bacterium]|nr:hypothetical protein [Planctomycetaceae bacterium]